MAITVKVVVITISQLVMGLVSDYNVVVQEQEQVREEVTIKLVVLMGQAHRKYF